MATATAITLRWADQLYLTQALTYGVPGNEPPYVPPDWHAQVLHFRKWYVACLMLLCGAVSAAKISLLLFFRQLVRRLQHMMVIWWLAAGVALAATALSLTSYVASCPHFDLERSGEFWGFAHLDSRSPTFTSLSAPSARFYRNHSRLRS